MESVATKAPKVVKEPVKITVAGVLAMLDAGKDREKIKAELGISHSDMALLFKNPALKGRKPKGAVRTKKAPGFILTDEAGTAVASETATDATQPTPEPSVDAPAATVAQEEVAPAPVAETLDKW